MNIFVLLSYFEGIIRVLLFCTAAETGASGDRGAPALAANLNLKPAPGKLHYGPNHLNLNSK